MELLVTLRNTRNIEKLRYVCDGFIVGSFFASGYSYSVEDLRKINNYCKENNLKFYICIDNFIDEEDKSQLYNYFDFIKSLNVDGIYFHDLGVIEIAKAFNLEKKLIYDGYTILCNSLDVAFYMSKGLNGVVLSRELTFTELETIVRNNPKCCDVMIFGHPRMSYSKRKFLTNYFKEINIHYDYLNKKTLSLVEEKRNYKMPIIEDQSGTKIYTDYILQMYKELSVIRPYINRGIVDSLFIDDDKVIAALRDYKHVTNENASFLLEGLNMKYPDDYSTGYLYQKTNITKDEQD